MGRFLDITELEAAVFSGEISGEAAEFPETEAYGTEEMVSEEPSEEIELELKDGQTMICEIIYVFVHEECEYMVLHPKEDQDGIVYLMRMSEGEDDELKLSPIEDEEELRKVSEIFREIYNNENSKGNEDHDRN